MDKTKNQETKSFLENIYGEIKLKFRFYYNGNMIYMATTNSNVVITAYKAPENSIMLERQETLRSLNADKCTISKDGIDIYSFDMGE